MALLPLEALKSFVYKRLKKGYPAGELRHELLRQGYAADEVEQVYTPRRSWNDPTQGFGWRQFQGPAGFVLLGLVWLREEHYFHFAVGCIVTGIACLLIKWLHWYENR
jgi:hypothetical protein